MKKALSLLLALVLCLSLYACSGEKIEGTYERQDGEYFVIDSENIHKYNDSELDFSESYSYEDGVLTFTHEDEDRVYWIRDGVLINTDPIDNGLIPYTDTFDVCCYSEDEDGWYRFEYNFYSDGTIFKYISFMGIRNTSLSGVYHREDNLIKINWENGTTNYCYTEDGVLYDGVYILADGE